jgi:hydrogenase maturation protease
MKPRRVLVAGVGNIFLGDDGFGVAVAQRMRGRPVPAGVRAEDFGIRALHLAYELLDGYDALVLVDAVPMGEPPGTVMLVEPELEDSRVPSSEAIPAVDAHSMSPNVVFDLMHSLGGLVDRIVIVGCQPSSVEEGIGLSAPVEAAIEPAVAAIERVLTEISTLAFTDERKASP